MRYRFYIVDVFTETRFGGNQLAVVTDARGLAEAQMQQVAREFGFSESTFVLPADDPAHLRRVRIFTPAAEVPFAGHPNVGTAFVLAATGAIEARDEAVTVVFEEAAGPVPVTVRFCAGRPRSCELTAPRAVEVGEERPVEAVARAVSLGPRDVVTDTHRPVLASVGLPFLFVEVRDREALARSAPVPDALERVLPRDAGAGIHLYAREAPQTGFDLRARMFAPLFGVAEDPATGSATAALAGLLAHCASEPDGEHRWRLAQGVEMGRPSVLLARAVKRGGRVASVHVGGACVAVADGWIEVA